RQIVGHLLLHPRGPQWRPNQLRRKLTPPLHHGHGIAVEEVGTALEGAKADPTFAHGREVAARQAPDSLPTGLHVGAVAQGLAPLPHHATQPSRRALRLLLFESGASDEVTLRPADDPAQFGL